MSVSEAIPGAPGTRLSLLPPHRRECRSRHLQAAWADKAAECDRLRAKNQEMYRANAMTLKELTADNARLEEEKKAAEEELTRARESAGRVEDLEKAKRAALEIFGTGLMSGVA